MSCHRHVWRTSPSAVLSDVFRWGKRYRVHKLMLLIQTYEKPCIKRTRIAEENTYYPRWFYLKYATEVIKYSFRNHLRLGTPLDPRDEQRLPSFAGLRAPTAAEREALLASVEAKLAAVHREILRMDAANVITNAPKARPATGTAAAAAAATGSAAAAGTAQQLHVTAADILRDLEVRKQGVLPSLAAFLQQHQQRLSSSASNTEQQQEGEQQQQQWSKDELRVLYFRLKKYVSLCKQRQQLRETLTLQRGQAGTAMWTRSLSDEQMHAELFSTMPSTSSSKQPRQNSSNVASNSLNKK